MDVKTVLYEEVAADSWSQNFIQFSFETSRPNYTINPLIYIKYRFKLTGLDNLWYHTDNAVQYPYSEGKNYIAFRQGWCIARGILSATTKINDKNIIRHNPSMYMDPTSRLYISAKQARQLCSGGPFDSGDFGHSSPQDLLDDVTANDVAARDTQLMSDFGWDALGGSTYNAVHAFPSESSYNKGFYERMQKLYKNIISKATVDYDVADQFDIVPNADDVFEVWEPIPCAPFVMFPGMIATQNLSFAKKLDVRLQLAPNMVPYMFEGELNGQNLPTIEWLEPQACVKYELRDTAVQVPRSIPVFTEDRQLFTINRSSDSIYLSGSTKWLTFDISPSVSKIYLFCRKAGRTFSDMTEHFLGIEKLQVHTPVKRHTLSSRQLYEDWTRECVDADSLSWDEWQNNKSVCVLDTNAMKLFRRVKIKVFWRNAWKIPRRYNKEPEGLDDGAAVDYECTLIYSTMTELNV